MKTFLTTATIFIISLTMNGFADYISPGNGSHFTMDSLVNKSAGAVTGSGTTYFINQSVQISTTDTLSIGRGKTLIFVDIAGSVQFDINGALFALGSVEDSIIFTSQNQTAGDYYGLRFRNTSTGSDFQLRYCKIEYATRAIDVVGDDVLVDHCLIQESGHTAIDLGSSNSIISTCVIRRNVQRTIFMTLSSSPVIRDNFIYENNSQNSSPYPFINIGLQGVNSPIILNNIITGGNEMSGGIAIWNDSNAEIKDNTIENCGYGILCYQFNANPYISNNNIRNNTIHPDTLNWGFAIACNGNNSPTITGNIIQGNYYGVAIINGAQPNVGNLSNADTTDDGYNQFLGNGIGSNLYELYNNNSLPISAENNWWNTDNPDSIEARIVHQVDNAGYGFVDFNPFIQTNPSGILESIPDISDDFDLLDAYPNPFNPTIQIAFNLKKNTNVKLKIYSITGELIYTLIDEFKRAGYHTVAWNGINSNHNNVSSGIYFYTMQTQKQIVSGKIALIR